MGSRQLSSDAVRELMVHLANTDLSVEQPGDDVLLAAAGQLHSDTLRALVGYIDTNIAWQTAIRSVVFGVLIERRHGQA